MKSLSYFIAGLLLIASALIAHSAWAECNGESWTPDSRFKINGSEVLDTKTNLIWKRCPEGVSWVSNTCTGKLSEMKWDEAMMLYSVAGKGWRLPNVNELATLRSGTNYDNEALGEKEGTGCWWSAINTTVFPGEQGLGLGGADYWSASTVTNVSDGAWYVGFDYGGVRLSYKRAPGYVRLVRFAY